ncbi:MAG: hypothetical protein FWF46_08820, partial [Oscillospiraceae bacterium]|nr:hypothetical protein [Oscillospiraceae bacterium]
TFRMVLYVDGDAKNVYKKPVEEKPAMLATFNNTSHYLWTSDASYGTIYVGPYFDQLSQMFPGIRDSDKTSTCIALLRNQQPSLIMEHYFYWGGASDPTDDLYSGSRTITIDGNSVTFTSGNASKTVLVIGNSPHDAGETICPYKDQSSSWLGEILFGVGVVVAAVVSYFCPPAGAGLYATLAAAFGGGVIGAAIAASVITAAAMLASQLVSNAIGGELGQILGAVVGIVVTLRCGLAVQ